MTLIQYTCLRGKEDISTYVVDLVDNLTGWVEAWALRKLKAEKVAEFLFDVMTRFGCIFQLTCNNGSEFFGATELLLQRYKVPVVRILAYNLRANGKIEQTHQSYMDLIWKVCKGRVVELFCIKSTFPPFQMALK